MLKRIAILAVLSTAAMAQTAATPAEGSNGAVPHRPASKAKVLTNSEFDGYLAHPEKVLVVDVRRPDEVSTIGGFPVYLSVQNKDIKAHLAEIPRDRPIITVSNHAARAGYAADTLTDAGFTVLGAVGADTYQKNGGTLAVKIPVPAPRAAAAADGAASAVTSGEGAHN